MGKLGLASSRFAKGSPRLTLLGGGWDAAAARRPASGSTWVFSSKLDSGMAGQSAEG
jgi:hypothetical protein